MNYTNDAKIQQKLSENQKIFLNALSNYIDDEVYLYGSISRFDYIPGKSDLDVDIFTDNEDSLIQKLSNLLDLKKEQFQKIVYRIDNMIINGYKTKYENAKQNLKIELSIYNKKNKQIIMKQHNKANNLPYIILVLLYILKSFYYRLGIISDEIYSKLKNFLLHMSSERNFILL
jgi:predicted nucleotidyltransferase